MAGYDKKFAILSICILAATLSTVLFLNVSSVWGYGFFAGSYEPYYKTEPRLVVIRYEIIDSESRAPVEGAEVRLVGTYGADEYLQKEFTLNATTGSDGIVVFGLSWKPWQYSYDHDVERVKSLIVRHSQYRFYQVSKTGLESLSDEGHRYYIFNYKHVGEFKDWLHGTGSRIFFFNGSFSRSEFFRRIRTRDYGKLKPILYHSINTAENRSGPFLVIEREIQIEALAPKVIILNKSKINTNKNTYTDDKDSYREDRLEQELEFSRRAQETERQRRIQAKEQARLERDRKRWERESQRKEDIKTGKQNLSGTATRNIDMEKRREINRDMGMPMGIVGVNLSYIDSSSPAYKAGLREGMIVTYVKYGNSNFTPTSNECFNRVMENIKPGQRVTIGVWHRSEGNRIKSGYLGHEQKGKWYRDTFSFVF